MMHAVYEHGGSSKHIKQLEQCVDEFQIPSSITIQLMALNAQSIDQMQQAKESVESNRQEFQSFYQEIPCYDDQLVDSAALIERAKSVRAGPQVGKETSILKKFFRSIFDDKSKNPQQKPSKNKDHTSTG